MIAPTQSETTNALIDASGTVNLALLRYLNVIDAILFSLWCIIERSELYYSAVQVQQYIQPSQAARGGSCLSTLLNVPTGENRFERV